MGTQHSHEHDDHEHSSRHSHHHRANAKNVKSLKWVLVFTICFMVVEALGGYYTNSLSLMSDAAHMFIDAAAISLSLFAFRISQMPATDKRTYGYYRFEILAAFINGVVLVFIAVGISYGAWLRFLTPEPIKSLEMLGIAVGGLIFNLISAYIITHGDTSHLNMKGALFHVLSDALGSVGVIAAALCIYFLELPQADPIASWMISVVILFASGKLVLDTFHMILDGTPPHLSLDDIRSEIQKIGKVKDVHDLHVWSITSGMVSLSVHVVAEECPRHDLLCRIRDTLRDKFAIEHVTIQIEDTSLEEHEPHI